MVNQFDENLSSFNLIPTTFQKRIQTDYDQSEDKEMIRIKIASHRKFKEPCERLFALSIEDSKCTTEQRRNVDVAGHGQSHSQHIMRFHTHRNLIFGLPSSHPFGIIVPCYENQTILGASSAPRLA